jgi:hypothetical protein
VCRPSSELRDSGTTAGPCGTSRWLEMSPNTCVDLSIISVSMFHAHYDILPPSFNSHREDCHLNLRRNVETASTRHDNVKTSVVSNNITVSCDSL